jgi:hypothetical protein
MAATCARFIAIQRQNTPRRHIPTPRKPRASINRSTKVDSFSCSQGLPTIVATVTGCSR